MSHNGCHIKGVMVIACNEALDFSLVRTEQDISLGLRFFCQNLGHLGHRTSRLILLLEMMA